MCRGARLIRVLAVVTIVATGCGGGSNGGSDLGQGTKLFLVTVKDHSYSPDRFEVQVGDSVTFRFVNVGQARHEAVIGDAAYQADHQKMMEEYLRSPAAGPPGQSRRARHHPGMNDPNAVLVEPGRAGEITFSFAKEATLYIGCHEPGHWEAGMKAVITVLPAG